MVALNDATTDEVCYDAANKFFHLPDGNQGYAISARFSDINRALKSFGGTALNTSYYWTSESDDSSTHKCIQGSGGSLSGRSDTERNYVREVVPLSYKSPWMPITSTTGLYLSVRNGDSRLLLTTANEIPVGYSPEGLAVDSKSIKVIISLTDASTDEMNYDSASLLYGNSLPDEDQGKLISARFSDINRALKSFGGTSLYSSWYWTLESDYSSTHKCIQGGGGSLPDRPDSEYHYVRLIVANNW